MITLEQFETQWLEEVVGGEPSTTQLGHRFAENFNERLKSVHAKFDAVLIQFDGLREYLYETDPQFDDERASRGRFEGHMVSAESQDSFVGAEYMELVRRKEAAGKRTLYTSFGDRG